MSQKFNKEILKNKVVKGRQDEVFEELLTYDIREDLKNQVRLLETRDHDLERTNSKGIISRDDYKVERNQINDSLFELIDDIDKELTENTDVIPAPTQSPSEPSRSSAFNPIYMALAVFGALIFGALLVLMGMYLLRSDKQMGNPSSGSDGADVIYVDKGKGTDSTSADETALAKEESKQVPPGISKEPSPQKPTSIDGVEIVATMPQEKTESPTTPKLVHEEVTDVTETFPATPAQTPTRYTCQKNCKQIRIEYNTKYEFIVYIKQGEQKKEIKKIRNEESITIEKGTHDIILKDVNRNEELRCSSCVINDSSTYIKFSHQYKNIEAK